MKSVGVQATREAYLCMITASELLHGVHRGSPDRFDLPRAARVRSHAGGSRACPRETPPRTRSTNDYTLDRRPPRIVGAELRLQATQYPVPRRLGDEHQAIAVSRMQADRSGDRCLLAGVVESGVEW